MNFVTSRLILIFNLLIYFSLSLNAQAKTLETVVNLSKAHAAELNAYNKYKKFAEQAEKEGYPLVSKLFRSVAFSELMHARNHGVAIENLGGKSEKVILNNVKVNTTHENLENSAKDERQDVILMYATFLAQAEKDGLRDAKASFKYASDSELQHKKLFAKGLIPLGPKNVDYYVDVVSGETVEVHPGDTVPESKMINGAYVKAAN